MRGGRRSGGGGMRSSSRSRSRSYSRSSSRRRYRSSSSTYYSSGSSADCDCSCCGGLFCRAIYCCGPPKNSPLPRIVVAHRMICSWFCWWGFILSFVAMLACVSFVPLYTSRSWSLPPAGTFTIKVNPHFFDGVTPLSGSAVQAYFLPAADGPPERVSQLTGDMVTEVEPPGGGFYRAMEVYLPAGARVTSILAGQVSCPLDYLIIRGSTNFDDWAYGDWVPLEWEGKLWPGQEPLTEWLPVSRSDHYFFVVYNSLSGPCGAGPLHLQLSTEAPAHRLPPARRVALGQRAAVSNADPGMGTIIFHTSSSLEYHDARVSYSRRPGALDLVLGLSIGLPYGLAVVVALVSWLVMRVSIARDPDLLKSTNRRLPVFDEIREISGPMRPSNSAAEELPTSEELFAMSADLESQARGAASKPVAGSRPARAVRFADEDPGPYASKEMSLISPGASSVSFQAGDDGADDGEGGIMLVPLTESLPPGLPSSGGPGGGGPAGAEVSPDRSVPDMPMSSPPPPYSAESSPSSADDGWSKY